MLNNRDIDDYIYRQIARNSPNGVLFLDLNATIRFWNRGAERIFGWPEKEIIGKSEQLLIPESSQILEISVQKTHGLHEYETERKTKSGKIILVHIAETQIHDHEKNLIGRSQIIQDITQRRKIESQVWQSEKLLTLGNLAAGVAHEIGNPLTSISSILQLMKRKIHDEAFLDPLNRIQMQINRISSIVRDLIDFSRPSPRRKTKTLVNEVIESAVGLIRYDSRAKNSKIEIIAAPDMPVIDAVPDQIHQIIVNLLLNSLDAIKENDGKIVVESWYDESKIFISVEDDGEGIESDILPHIFEPFFTTKEVGKGTGLGLSVTHGIITAMGGSIEVESSPGKGSRFLITLPRQSGGK